MRADEFSPIRQARGSEQIAEALRGVQFPIAKEELVARLGDLSLAAGGTRAPLAEIVRGVPQAQLQDRRAAERAVSSRWANIAKALAAVEELEEKKAGREGRPRD